MQRICQDFVSIQQPQLLAREGGGCKKETDCRASKALELTCRELQAPGTQAAQWVGVSSPLQSVLAYQAPEWGRWQNRKDYRDGHRKNVLYPWLDILLMMAVLPL